MNAKKAAGHDRKRQNFSDAFAALQRFLAEPNRSEAVEAGIIQGFEFTFEQCWKLFQSLAQHDGLDAPSPKAALKAALKLHLIENEAAWLSMLEDRNLASHTYRPALARALVARIEANYVDAFARALLRSEKRLEE